MVGVGDKVGVGDNVGVGLSVGVSDGVGLFLGVGVLDGWAGAEVEVGAFGVSVGPGVLDAPGVDVTDTVGEIVGVSVWANEIEGLNKNKLIRKIARNVFCIFRIN